MPVGNHPVLDLAMEQDENECPIKEECAFCLEQMIKIINYANEIGQATTPMFQTVATAVKKLGIPNWVVQVRHAAAHQYFPSIDLFRKSAKFCREWLWDVHWGRPMKEAMGIAMEKEVITPSERAVNLIVSYIMFRMKSPKKRISDEEMRTEEILCNINKFASSDASNFIRAFLFDGHLIMTEEQLEIADYNADDGNEVWCIPEDLQLFWEPILRLLSQLNALPELLHQTIFALGDIRIKFPRERQLVAWADYMLTAFSKADKISQADWKRIMKTMISVRVSFKREHYSMLMSKISLISNKKRRQLRRLLNLSLNGSALSDLNASTASANGTTSVRTLDDLRELIGTGSGNATIAEDPITGEQNWITCDPTVWRGVPLGLTPEQSAESLCLIIDKDFT